MSAGVMYDSDLRITAGVVARIDGSSVSDITEIYAVETEAYTALFEPFFGTPTLTSIDGTEVSVWEPSDAGMARPIALVPFDEI